MDLKNIAYACFCALAISCGQLLFRRAGIEIGGSGNWWSRQVLIYVVVAGLVYVFATLLWINLLRYVGLNQAYPFMALSFLFVPLASRYFFNEPFHAQQLFGTCMIFAGLVIVSMSPR